jgi:hypothetical protein
MLENDNDIDPLFTYLRHKNTTPYSHILPAKTALIAVYFSNWHILNASVVFFSYIVMLKQCA